VLHRPRNVALLVLQCLLIKISDSCKMQCLLVFPHLVQLLPRVLVLLIPTATFLWKMLR
jgi:hypothetical protein